MTKHYLVVTANGILILGPELETVRMVDLPQDPMDRADRFMSLQRGESIPELQQSLEDLETSTLVVENENLREAINGLVAGVEIEFPSPGGRKVRRSLAASGDYLRDSRELGEEISSQKMRSSYKKWDQLVVHAVGAMEELDKDAANLYGLCREWYSIHFPELERILRNQTTYSQAILQGDPRDSVSENLDISEKKIKRIQKEAENSVGTTLGETDLEAIRELARSILYLSQRRETLDGYLERLMCDHAPTLTRVGEAGVGARLIAKAGSLKKLALMPSSSVQTLGAEKALFRHLTKGAKPPKHGTIFQHPYVRNSPKSIRGKAASILAAKISLAARSDYIFEVDKGKKMKEELDAAIKTLRREAS